MVFGESPAKESSSDILAYTGKDQLVDAGCLSRVLAWHLLNMLTTDFCIEALEEVIIRYGTPEIFNTDQGS